MKVKTHKWYIILVGFLSIVILFLLLLDGIRQQKNVVIVRNVEKSNIVFGWTPAFSSIYASKIKYQSTFEADISEDDFIKYCQQNNWIIELFCNLDIPLKIIRYNWVESIDKYEFEKKTLDIDHENDNSCFHFVRQGYQYNNLYGEKNHKGLRIFIVYDKCKRRVYAYYYNR
jgi:hypothetical protein